jgi:hypothetical protein
MTIRKYIACLLTMSLIVTSLIVAPADAKSVDDLAFNAQGKCGAVLLTWNDAYPGQWYMPEMILPTGESYPLIDYAIQDTSYIHKGVVNDQEYCYILKVVDQGDNELDSSEQVCATPQCKHREVPGTLLDCDNECMLFLCFQIDSLDAQVTWADESFFDVIDDGGLVDINGKIMGNKNLNWDPVISEGRTCAGPRDITDNIPGASIGWDAKEKHVDMSIPRIVYADGTQPNDFIDIQLWIGNPTAVVDGIKKQIDPTNINVVPFVETDENGGGHTQLPVRFISENTGAKDIRWLPENKIPVFVFDVENCNGPYCNDDKKKSSDKCSWSCGHIEDEGSYWAFTTNASLYPAAFSKDEYAKLPSSDGTYNDIESWYNSTYTTRGFACVEFCIDDQGKLVAWNPLYSSYPNCCVDECCDDIHMLIPIMVSENNSGTQSIFEYENYRAELCLTPGEVAGFDSLFFTNNCDNEVCVKFESSLEDFNLTAMLDPSTGGTVPLVSPYTIPKQADIISGVARKPLFSGRFTVPDCEEDEVIEAFRVIQVDCQTGIPIPDCPPKIVSIRCCDDGCQWTNCLRIFRMNSYYSAYTYDCVTEETIEFSGPGVPLVPINADEVDWADANLVTYGVGNCAKFCVNENNWIIKWEAIPPDDECCCKEEEACCDFDYRISGVPKSACPGDTIDLAVAIKNECDQGLAMELTVDTEATVVSSKKPVFVYRLRPEQTESKEITIKMPEDCDEGDTVELSFHLVINDTSGEECFNDVIESYEIRCNDCSTCCDFSTQFGTINIEEEHCQGDEVLLEYYITNNCEDESMIFSIKPQYESDYYEEIAIDDDSFTLSPGDSKPVQIYCTIPDDCIYSSSYRFSVTAYDSDKLECGEKWETFKLLCTDCEPCCDISCEFLERFEAYCPGEEAILKYGVENNCYDQDLTIVLEQYHGDLTFDYESFTLPARTGREVKITAKMLEDCVDGQQPVYEFHVFAYSDDEEEVCDSHFESFSLTCEDCTCCDMDITTNSRSTPEICAGQTDTYEIRVINNCKEQEKHVKAVFSKLYSSNVKSITPTSATIAPQEDMIFDVELAMPENCKPGSLVNFIVEMSVDGCDSLIMGFKGKCKSCNCCDVTASSITKLISEYCPGEEGRYLIRVRNNCDNQSKTISINGSSNIYNVKPETFELEPGKTKDVFLFFTMPDDCKAGSSQTFRYKVGIDDCNSLSKSFTAECKKCGSSKDPQYVGNSSTKKFHTLTCNYVKKIATENKVYFYSRQEAINKGYTPCGVCKP